MSGIQGPGQRENVQIDNSIKEKSFFSQDLGSFALNLSSHFKSSCSSLTNRLSDKASELRLLISDVKWVKSLQAKAQSQGIKNKSTESEGKKGLWDRVFSEIKSAKDSGNVKTLYSLKGMMESLLKKTGLASQSAQKIIKIIGFLDQEIAKLSPPTIKKPTAENQGKAVLSRPTTPPPPPPTQKPKLIDLRNANQQLSPKVQRVLWGNFPVLKSDIEVDRREIEINGQKILQEENMQFLTGNDSNEKNS